jgi:hypothetical protein
MLGLAPRIPLPIQACAEETDNRHGQREHQRSDLAKIHLPPSWGMLNHSAPLLSPYENRVLERPQPVL